MKDTFYLKHDLDSRDDEAMRALLMKHGTNGYGLFWMIVEDLHHNNGRLKRDFSALAWCYRRPSEEIKSIVDDFALFYKDGDKIGSRRVDREREERREAQRQASLAGKASAAARAAQRALNDRSTDPQPGEERRGEERKGEERTTAPAADVFKLKHPNDLKDPLDMKFPYGKMKGRRIGDMPADECQFVLEHDPRPSAELKAALKARIKQKRDEMTPAQQRAS